MARSSSLGAQFIRSIQSNGLAYTLAAGSDLIKDHVAPQRGYLYERLPFPYTHTHAGNSASFQINEVQEFLRITGAYGGARYNLTELIQDVRPSDTFYELGANIGVYSCLVGDSLTDGQVVAFEPHPKNADRLRTHLEYNGIDSIVQEAAISNDQGEIELKIDGSGAGAGCHSISPNKSGKSITVPVETLDALVEAGEIPPPNVVQMDVEGVEYNVVDGATETFSRDDCRLIHIQVHREVKEGNQLSDFGVDEAELVSLLEECGFETSFQNPEHVNGYLIGRK